MSEETLLEKYLDAGIFEIAGRYYRFASLSAFDYFPTAELFEKIVRHGAPSASFLSSLVLTAPTHEDYERLRYVTVPDGPPDAEGKQAFRQIELSDEEHQAAIDGFLEQRRSSFMLVIGPVFGIPLVRDEVMAWVLSYLRFVPNPAEPTKNNTPLKKEDFSDPSIMPLNAIPTLVMQIVKHPDLKSFFDEAKKVSIQLQKRYSDPQTLTQ